MKRKLRHPIREPFGKAGLTVAICALVMAMVGGAYAAGGLTKSQEKQVTKIAKKYAGKPGAAGTNGANGTNGSPGTKGDSGASGANGTNGESVTITPISSPGCEGQAGVKFKNATGEGKACNGKNGTTGFTKTLPSGETETGTWAFGSLDPETIPMSFGRRFVFLPISFNVPLTASLSGSGCDEEISPCQVHYINKDGKEVLEFGAKEVESIQCKGTVAAPTAEPGNLCVYTDSLSNTVMSSDLINVPAEAAAFVIGAGTTGAVLVGVVNGSPGSLADGFGTWAVTAE